MQKKMNLKPLWNDFTYFPHQVQGINWMLDMEKIGTIIPGTDDIIRGGFQCDDMGLGKTIQIASVIINNMCDTLIISPLAMIQTWSSVLQNAECVVYEVDKSNWVLMNDPDRPIPCRKRPVVYITNYEKLYRRPALFHRSWGRVVLDEAHKIRNGDSEVARCARNIVAPIRWAVTGTPLVNSKSDISSLLAFIGVPYSPLWRWKPWYDTILPDLLIHRALTVDMKGAPPKPEIYNIDLPFITEEEEEFYYGVQGATESMLVKYSSEILSSFEMFKLLLRLRQISVHPQVYINAKRRENTRYAREDWITPSTKTEKIKEIITTDIGIHKYIIFCQFNDEMDIIRESLEGIIKDENILQYSGSMNQKERTEVLDISKKTTEKTVMLIQLQAGGVGLNLQEYDRIIFVSPWWTSALMDQAIARAVRMGQTQIVKVYNLKLVAENSKSINIDNLVNSKAEEKRKMLEKLFEMCARDSL